MASGDLFTLENSKKKGGRQKKQKSGGIGLNNIQRRLAYHYPECYRLIIEDQEHYFGIWLELRGKNHESKHLGA